MQRALLNAKDDILVSWRYQCERSRATELEGSMFGSVLDSLRQASVSKSRKTEIVGLTSGCLFVGLPSLPSSQIKVLRWVWFDERKTSVLCWEVSLQLIGQMQVYEKWSGKHTFRHSQHLVSPYTASRPQLCACDQGVSLSRSSCRSNRITTGDGSEDRAEFRK